MSRQKASASGEVLVAILPEVRDLEILLEEGWYRFRQDHLPKRWPTRLAFYQGKVFGADAYRINYFAEVKGREEATRVDLFPGEPSGEKADRKYVKVSLDSIQRLERPIPSTRPRRITFVPTTYAKFERAEQLNDLFDDSPLEDAMWGALKTKNIPAERQWYVEAGRKGYYLDFAIFCERENLAVETEGEAYHSGRDQVAKDRIRSNALESMRWHILRFDTASVREQLEEYCVPQVLQTITVLGGLTDEGPVSRRFYPGVDGVVEQLSLFESGPTYEPD